jgi:large subunit ribosomal protein L31
VKPEIHPEYVVTTVTCSCGNTFETRSTAKNGSIHSDVCSACHPFYTGKQKILDAGGRVSRFEQRYGKSVASTPGGDVAPAEAVAPVEPEAAPEAVAPEAAPAAEATEAVAAASQS